MLNIKAISKFVIIFFLFFTNSYSIEKVAFINIDLVIKRSNIGIVMLTKIETLNNQNIEKLKIKQSELKDLEDEIKKLEGKKIIFTNGSKAHALNVTKRIGIDKLFDGIFDIRDCEFIPKPSKEPYKKLVENYKIEPQYCIFFEDIARNLKPAYELGMKTVWIKNDEPWAAKYSDSEFINYKTDNLAKFLKEINELR